MTKELVLSVLACVAIGYLIGCISPAFFAGKRRGYDVRESGSKNAGASNVLLMAGKFAGAIVALLDIFKAFGSWKLAEAIFPELPAAGMIAGASCVFGHMYPVFLGFRGGKGLACLGGLALAGGARMLLIMLAVALLIALISNYICIVAVSMSLIIPLYFGLSTGCVPGALILALPAPLIIYKHRENFRRIAEGKEIRLSFLWKRDSELERAGYAAVIDEDEL